MPIVITSNFTGSVKLSIANGTRRTVFSWIFPDGTTFEEQQIFADSTSTVLKASKLVSVVFVCIPGLYSRITPSALQKLLSVLPHGFPPDIFPLVPMAFYAKNVNIKSHTNLSFSIRQIPINISVSGTLYKFQSLKIDYLLLDELREGEHPFKPPPESLYVAVSRATLLDNLYLIKPLTDKDWEYFRPSPLVLEELARLEDAATATKQRLNHYLQEIALSSTTSAAEMTS